MTGRYDPRSGQPEEAPSGQPSRRPAYWEAQPGHDFTLQAVQELDRTVAVLNDRVSRLREDRKEDRDGLRAELKELKSEIADFRKNEFKTLSDEVIKMKIHWAKVVGGAAVVGAIVSYVVDLLKAKWGG